MIFQIPDRHSLAVFCMFKGEKMKLYIGLISLIWCGQAFCGIGDIDNREYVQWGAPPYDKIVYFYPKPYYTCTAQYVAPDIILTARHCITANRKFDNYKEVGKTFEIWTHDNRRTQVVLERYGRDFKSDDWALLRIGDAAFYRNDFFDVASKTGKRYIQTAGFAGLRILSNDEIHKLKQIFINVARENNINILDFSKIWEMAADYMRANGIADLYDSRVPNGGSGQPGEWEFKLKANKSCRIYENENKGRFLSTCDTDHGDSGGPYFSGMYLYGIVSGGFSGFDDDIIKDIGVRTERFYKQLQEMKKATPIAAISESEKTTDIDNDENTLMEIDKNLHQKVMNVDKMSDKDFLKLLSAGVDYKVLKDSYQRAKQREQSPVSRLTAGLAIGAAGIGGMQILSGLAEQDADADAERNMRAYLATFTCDYGRGRNIRGGETGIELPGANDLMPMVTEYRALASDIAQRKVALNMTPGIESEIIFDKSDVAINDNESIGRQPGAFTSLSRALMDKDSVDAKAYEKQKSDTKQKIKTGAIVGGAGALIGIGGNIAGQIQKNKDEKEINSK